MYQSGAEMYLDNLLKRRRLEDDFMTPSMGRPYNPTRASYSPTAVGYDAMHSKGIYKGLMKTLMDNYSKSMQGLYSGKGLYSSGYKGIPTLAGKTPSGGKSGGKASYSSGGKGSSSSSGSSSGSSGGGK